MFEDRNVKVYKWLSLIHRNAFRENINKFSLELLEKFENNKMIGKFPISILDFNHSAGMKTSKIN